MWLSKKIREAVTENVQVFYLNWTAARMWNQKRDKGEPMVFTGWYWAHRGREGGPFKSMSSAYRDAWYLIVEQREPPLLHKNFVKIESRLQRGRRKGKNEVEMLAEWARRPVT
jgi:hypothetical protein